MGMFDELRCERELPAPNADGLLFQTKDTPSQWLDSYVIRPDGTLWHQVYDTEDRSDPNAEGLGRLIGSMTRVNPRWESVPLTGEVCFYTGGGYDTDNPWWLEFSAYFKDGQLQQLNLLTDTRKHGEAA